MVEAQVQFDLESAIEQRLAQLKSDPRRQRAYDAFADHGLPHRRVEGWRWSDVRAALKKATGVEKPGSNAKFSAVDASVIRFHDGGLDLPSKRPAGAQWIDSKDAVAFSSAEELPMGALAAAMADKPATLTLEIAADQIKPISIEFDFADELNFAHVVIVVREGANATILEDHANFGAMSNVVLDYVLEPNASIQRVVAQTASESSVQVVSAKVRLQTGAKFEQFVFGTGGKLARVETHLTHHESGSEATLNGAYLLKDGAHSDITTHVRHSSADCTSQQTIKGAVAKGGQGVFQGKYFVARDAQKTDAEMSHNALLLEDGATVFAKPELEIYADDVQCAHGNTCGALDADMLFYMRQRGIPLKEARALLIESFIADAFDDLSHEQTKDILMEEAREWLRNNL